MEWPNTSSRAAWDKALAEYQRLRGIADATADDDSVDRAVDAYHDAMDVLLVETRAPDAAAACLKIDLLRSRFDGFTTPDEHWNALKADLHSLIGEA
ncbi:hypothetical protein [Sphingomonas jatrophae]|uniref:Uncharacterized protein n=1 Tax=Sphingomonas jatrophae TaxID=1166337 RepID=A0A1I6L2M9_9SPHN|nr:hypothetical protein [Sphingomonas jatrophae]SFR97719.1 hypothetical protein SAMN05192580_2198 [Sphingomonas jatrophae]